MSEEPDRVAMLSDVRTTERRLESLIKAGHEEMRRHMDEHHERMRRHFDIMTEKVHDAVKIVAEVSAHHATVLDNHERRLTKIERHHPA